MSESIDGYTNPKLKVKSNRSYSATCCSIVEVLFYGLLSAFIIFYLSYFAYVNGKLKNHKTDDDHYCAFFANEDKLGSAGSCLFFLGGTGVLVGLLLILLILGVFNALCGKWSGCLRGFEIFVLLLASLLSLVTNMVLSIGYHISCDKMKGCDNFEKHYSYNVKDKMVIIEPVAWVVTCALVVLLVIQFVSCMCVCCRKKSHSSEYDGNNMYDEKRLLNANQDFN